MSSPTDSSTPLTQPPKVYRAMRRDPVDGLPVVGSTSSSELGVRRNFDINIDAMENVVLDGGGMSVAPGWRDLELARIPKRLGHIVPGARGANNTSCYAMGVGPFENGIVSTGLQLIPDEGPALVTHGVVAPVQAVLFAQYQVDLVNTRDSWQIDET